MAKLLFKKDGSLNKETESGYDDVSEFLVFHLNDDIEFEHGVTLKDFFMLLQPHMNLLVPIFGNWIDEYTDVIIHGEPDPPRTNLNPVNYLRVFWTLHIEEGSIEIPAWPDFEGVGKAIFDDQFYKVGDVIKWGIGLDNMANYSHLPLILDNVAQVWSDDSKESKVYKSNPFILYQVIQGIIWEISFFGNPQRTAEVMNNLSAQAERIAKGEEKTYPLDDLLN